MFEDVFHLSGPPFKINPDPRFFYGSRSHNKAMAYLHYGLRQAEGFIVITGEIGAGKSILISHLLDQLDRSRITAANLITPNLKAEDLLAHVLSAFRIEPASNSPTAAIEAFEDFLFDELNNGKRVLLIIDEAQNLPVETIEELRVLSNMDYDGTPLFQVFLVGQPDFRPVLAGPNMEQLRQRVIASYHLEPLSDEETRNYIQHRLSIVGWQDDPQITDDAFVAIFERTGGVPRKINKLCNRILMHCAVEEQHHIDRETVFLVDDDLQAENQADAALVTPVVDEGPIPTPQESAAAAFDGADLHEEDETIAPMAVSEEANDIASVQETTSLEEVAPVQETTPIQDTMPTPMPLEEEPMEHTSMQMEDEGQMEGEAMDNDDINTQAPSSLTAASTDEEISTQELDAVATALTTTQAATPPISSADGASQMSVLDRLRASKLQELPAASPVPQEASIGDVATAIAAVTTQPDDTVHILDDGDAVEPPAASAALMNEEMRDSILRSIGDTKADLKKAHGTLTGVRRQWVEDRRERDERRQQIVHSLGRAQAILTDLRKAWQAPS